MRRLIACCLVGLACALLAAGAAQAQERKAIRIGFVTFLSGPAAGPFGVPAKIAAEAIVESLNAGKAPAPYNTRGFGGTPLELVIIDEAGGTTKQVSEFRNLVERQNVDFVIGYISSGDCLAIAPVAEEMKKLTVLFDCGTPRVFEERELQVRVPHPSARHDGCGGGRALPARAAARRQDLRRHQPELRLGPGLVERLRPGDEDAQAGCERDHVADAQVRRRPVRRGDLRAGSQTNSDVIHSSLWGGDLEAFMMQAVPRGLFNKSQLVLVAGEPYLHRLGSTIPDGTIVGARGTHGVFAPDSKLNTLAQGHLQGQGATRIRTTRPTARRSPSWA